MDPQVNELTSDIIELCAKKLSCNQTIAFDGHILITVDSYQLLFLEIKHTHQKESLKNPASKNLHVPPKKKLLHNRQRFHSLYESSEDEPDLQKVASSFSGEEQSDLDKRERSTGGDDKNLKKFKGDEKAKRHWKKGRKKAFTDAEASRQKEATKTTENNSRSDNELPSQVEKTTHENAVKQGRTHTCEHCSFSSTYRHCLKRHVIRKHSKETGGAVPPTPTAREVCSSCGKTFKTKDSLRIHTSLKHGTSGKRYTCKICDKEFYMRVHFDGHMNKHRNERPYTCAVCGKGFLYVQNVKRHERTCGLSNKHKQKDEAPIECRACGITFKTKDYYKDHMAAKHCQAPKYQCPVCKKLFRIRGSYYRHKMMCTKRVGLEPGEVHPGDMESLSSQNKGTLNSLTSQQQDDSQKQVKLQHKTQQSRQKNQEAAQQQDSTAQLTHSTHPDSSTSQSLPNVHQLYHHYRRVQTNEHEGSHLNLLQFDPDTQSNVQNRESFHQDTVEQLQHYQVHPQNMYLIASQNTRDNQINDSGNGQAINDHADLHDLQVCRDPKVSGHNAHQLHLLHDLQPADLQNQSIDSAHDLISRSELFSSEDDVQGLQLPALPSSSLEVLQNQEKSPFQRQARSGLYTSPKKFSGYSGQVYDSQRQPRDYGQIFERQFQGSQIRNFQIMPRVGKSQSHDQASQSREIQGQFHDLQQQSPQQQAQQFQQSLQHHRHPQQCQSQEHQSQQQHQTQDLQTIQPEIRQGPNLAHLSHSTDHIRDLNRDTNRSGNLNIGLIRSAEQARTILTQSRDYQQSSQTAQDLLDLSQELQKSQNDDDVNKRTHQQQSLNQSPHNLSSQSHVHDRQIHESSRSVIQSDIQKGNIQVDAHLSQNYSGPIEMHPPQGVHAPNRVKSHGDMPQHGHKNPAECNAQSPQSSQRNDKSLETDMQCMMLPYSWVKQVN